MKQKPSHISHMDVESLGQGGSIRLSVRPLSSYRDISNLRLKLFDNVYRHMETVWLDFDTVGQMSLFTDVNFWNSSY